MRLSHVLLIAPLIWDPITAGALTTPPASAHPNCIAIPWTTQALESPIEYALAPLEPIHYPNRIMAGNLARYFSVGTTWSYFRHITSVVKPTPEIQAAISDIKNTLLSVFSVTLGETLNHVHVFSYRYMDFLGKYDPLGMISMDRLAFGNRTVLLLATYHEMLHAKLHRLRKKMSETPTEIAAEEISVIYNEIIYYLRLSVEEQEEYVEYLAAEKMIESERYLKLLIDMRTKIYSIQAGYKRIASYLRVSMTPQLENAILQVSSDLASKEEVAPEADPNPPASVPISTDELLLSFAYDVSPFSAALQHLKSLYEYGFVDAANHLASLLRLDLNAMTTDNFDKLVSDWRDYYPHAKASLSKNDAIPIRDEIMSLVRDHQHTRAHYRALVSPQLFASTLFRLGPERLLHVPKTPPPPSTPFHVHFLDENGKPDHSKGPLTIEIKGWPSAEHIMFSLRAYSGPNDLDETHPNWQLLINGKPPNEAHLGEGINVSATDTINVRQLPPMTPSKDMVNRREFPSDLRRDTSVTDTILAKLQNNSVLVGLSPSDMLIIQARITELSKKSKSGRLVVQLRDDIHFIGGPLAMRFRPETAKSPVPILEIAPQALMARRIEEERKSTDDLTAAFVTASLNAGLYESITGRWGGPAMFLGLMPILEELGRVWFLGDVGVPGTVAWIFGYALIHALAHFVVDYKQGGWDLVKSLFWKRVGLSLLFSWFGAAGSGIGYLFGYNIKILFWIFSLAAHIYNNWRVWRTEKGLAMSLIEIVQPNQNIRLRGESRDWGSSPVAFASAEALRSVLPIYEDIETWTLVHFGSKITSVDMFEKPPGKTTLGLIFLFNLESYSNVHDVVIVHDGGKMPGTRRHSTTDAVWFWERFLPALFSAFNEVRTVPRDFFLKLGFFPKGDYAVMHREMYEYLTKKPLITTDSPFLLSQAA